MRLWTCRDGRSKHSVDKAASSVLAASSATLHLSFRKRRRCSVVCTSGKMLCGPYFGVCLAACHQLRLTRATSSLHGKVVECFQRLRRFHGIALCVFASQHIPATSSLPCMTCERFQQRRCFYGMLDPCFYITHLGDVVGLVAWRVLRVCSASPSHSSNLYACRFCPTSQRPGRSPYMAWESRMFSHAVAFMA